MKRKGIILALMMVALVTSGFAQSFPTDQGGKILSGSLSFSSMSGDLYENADEESATSLMLAPSVSYFMWPGLAVGGKCVFMRSAQGDFSMNRLGIGPHVLYFIGGNKRPDRIRGATYPYLGASFLYLRNTSKNKDYESTSTGNTIGLGLGVLHMLTNTVGITGEISYEIDRLKGENADEATTGNKINFFLGMSAFLF